jgi:hypothetical protein
MRTALAAVVAAGTAPFLLAQEGTESKATLDSVSMGDHLYGPKRGLEDLKGRVVLIDFWGRK